MRSKLSAALLLTLLVTGTAWIFAATATATPESVAQEFGCCVTGDCCCPGQGDCCDLTAKAKVPASVKVVKKAQSCCLTGDCCCPGQGDCCDLTVKAKKTTAKVKSCCTSGGKKNCCR